MGDVLLFNEPGHLTPTPPAEERVGVVAFRGRSLHRDQGCTNPRGPDRFDRCCARCDWGAFVCRTCGGAEGSLPTDCPRVTMTEEQEALVMSGGGDYILAQGGWTSIQSARRPLPVCQEVS